MMQEDDSSQDSLKIEVPYFALWHQLCAGEETQMLSPYPGHQCRCTGHKWTSCEQERCQRGGGVEISRSEKGRGGEEEGKGRGGGRLAAPAASGWIQISTMDVTWKTRV